MKGAMKLRSIILILSILAILSTATGNFGSIIFALCLLIGGSVAVLHRMAKVDIVRRKEAETALRKSESRYRLLTENAKDMIYRMSLPDGRYEFVSPASVDVFGYKPEEFYNSPILIQQIIHPDWQAYFKKQWALLMEGKMPSVYEYQIIHNSGETRWIHQRNVLLRDGNEKPIAIEGIATDISKTKQIELALQSTKDILSAIFESTADGILVANNENRIMLYNRRFLEQWQIPDDLIHERNDEKTLDFALNQLTEPDAFLAKVQALYNSPKADLDWLYFKDGKIFERFSRPLLQAEKITGRVWSFRDVTEKRQSEREREKLILDLQVALEEVRSLRGILPICSHCKKIRDDKGYWNQIESYIHKHSDVEFSHSICQECAEKYYPDMVIYDDNGEITED